MWYLWVIIHFCMNRHKSCLTQNYSFIVWCKTMGKSGCISLLAFYLGITFSESTDPTKFEESNPPSGHSNLLTGSRELLTKACWAWQKSKARYYVCLAPGGRSRSDARSGKEKVVREKKITIYGADESAYLKPQIFSNYFWQ